MPNQIILAWTVSSANSVRSPAQVATALAAVELYQNPNTDPILGQLFGLSVETDATVAGPASATRTLTLNMFKQDDENPAPPSFPCRPRTSTPPELPYPLRRQVTLPGSFFVTNGSMNIDTTATMIPSLVIGDEIQFLTQRGVFYAVSAVGATTISISTPFTGLTGNTKAFKEVAAPATRPAIFSTSDLDTNGVATTPAIAAGSGARTISIEYTDSAGNSDGLTVQLNGRRPVEIVLEPGTIDIASIDAVFIATAGSFGNSVGQITIVDLESALPAIEEDATPEEFFGELTDEAQLLIDRHLVYMTQSYFSLVGQMASRPQLSGDFFVTTGSTNVPTSEDQSGELTGNDPIEFAAQPGKRYTVAAVTPKIVTLTEAYSGIDNNNTGIDHNRGTKGNVGKTVTKKRTGATLLSTPGAPPANAQLAGPLAQFSETQVAAPPPDPPLSPATVPAPTFLSGFFTQKIQLALRGVPITPATITFA